MGADLYKNAAPSLAGDFRCFSSEESITPNLIDCCIEKHLLYPATDSSSHNSITTRIRIHDRTFSLYYL